MTPRDIPAALWLALVLFLVPWGAIENERRKRAGIKPSPRAAQVRALPRPRLYVASMLGMLQFFVVAVLLDWIDHFAVAHKALAFPRDGLWWILACVAAHQAISVATMGLRRLRGLPLDAGIARLMPHDGVELLRFVPLALSAGIYEEFMYRGFAPDHLVRWGLPLWLGWGLTTLSFGFAHGYKSMVGMLRSALVGLVLAVPVLATGALLPSIIAHAVMDLLAGSNTLRLARRLGVTIPEPEPTPAERSAPGAAS